MTVVRALRAFSAASIPHVARPRPLKVVVGLSGGVDSSVTALLLKEAGFEVHCCFMKNWDSSDEAGAGLSNEPCPIEADYQSAVTVAKHLDLPLSRVDFSKKYWNEVFEPMLEAYAAGRTPNPDTDCNRFIKFGAFRQHALEVLGCDLVATGHWAQLRPAVVSPWAPLPTAHIDHGHEPPRLVAAVDGKKDQSDFLSLVPRESLRRVLFPLGPYSKAQIRALATAAGLPTAARKDSTGICFVGRRKLKPFLMDYIDGSSGNIQDVSNSYPVARTTCVESYTPGQRVKVSGLRAAYYVSRVQMSTYPNGSHIPGMVEPVVYAARGEHHPALYSDCAVVRLDQLAGEAGRGEAHEHSSRASTDGPAESSSVATPHPLVPSTPVPFVPRLLEVGPAALATFIRGASSAPDPLRALALPVLFRDRHRQEDLRQGHAIVVRYGTWLQAWKLLKGPDIQEPITGLSGDASVLLVRFESPHRAVAPGQVMVVHHVGAAGQDVQDVRAAVPPSTDAQDAVRGASSAPDAAVPGIVPPIAAAVPNTGYTLLQAADRPQPLVFKGQVIDPPQHPCWNGAGKDVIAAGPIWAAGPSWWDQGLMREVMPLHLQQQGTGKARVPS